MGGTLGSGPIQDKHSHKYSSATVIVGGGGTQTPRHLCVGTNDCKGWPECSMLFGTAENEETSGAVT